MGFGNMFIPITQVLSNHYSKKKAENPAENPAENVDSPLTENVDSPLNESTLSDSTEVGQNGTGKTGWEMKQFIEDCPAIKKKYLKKKQKMKENLNMNAVVDIVDQICEDIKQISKWNIKKEVDEVTSIMSKVTKLDKLLDDHTLSKDLEKGGEKLYNYLFGNMFIKITQVLSNHYSKKKSRET